MALIVLLVFICNNVEGQTYVLNSTTNGTTINTCGGTFYDSGINSNYSDFEDLSITICSDAGQQVELDFSFFDVEYQSSCNYDVFSIYDGINSSSTLIGDFCGTNLPTNIISTNDCLHVTFFSDYVITEGGWVADIICATSDEICGNNIDDDGDGATDEFCNSCPTGSIGYERWLGISGSSLSNLTGNSNFPNNASESGSFTSFQGPIGYADNYGTRVQGILKPAQTGDYQFTVTSDDQSELYISTDGDPANKLLVASVPGWTNVNQFDKYPEQISTTISLTAGANYYIEMLHKEGGGGDHLQVFWTTPSSSVNTIIPGSVLSPLECCSLIAGPDESICLGASANLTTVASGFGAITYSWSPTNGLSSSTIQNPIASPLTTTTYTVTLSDAAGCTSTDEVVVTVIDAPSINLQDENICVGETSNVTPTATGASPFIFDWGSATTSGNTLTVSPTTTTTYTVTVTDDNNCTNTASTVITVDQLPAVSLNLPDIEFCITDANVALSGGTPLNGSYSGNGIINNTLNLNNAGLGVHTITYTFTDGNGCTNTDTQVIQINDLPTVNLDLDVDEVCIGNTTLLLSGGTPAGGEYSNSFVTGNIFDIASAGVGVHTITYTYEDGNGCENSTTEDIEVHDLPAVTLAITETEHCVNETDYSLSGGVPTGGDYSGPGVVNNVFDASVAGVGTHTIQYEVTDLNGCINNSSDQIEVFGLPAVNFDFDVIEECINNTNLVLSGGTPTGGTYSGPGVSGSSFSPSLAGIGLHVLSYTIEDINGCESTATHQIYVNDIQTVNLNLPINESCHINGTISLSGGSPSGGEYSGIGVNDTDFEIMTAGIGTHTITYTYEDGNGCIVVATDQIEIYNLPTIDLVLPSTNACISESTFTLSGGTPAGGIYSGNTVVGTNFNPSTAGLGLHTIVYTYEDGNGCVNTASQDIEVHDLPTVTFDLSQDEICLNSVGISLSGGSPSGGVYSGIGVLNNNFSPSGAGLGTHTITYTYEDGNGCESTATDEIEVLGLPAVSMNVGTYLFCIDQDPIDLQDELPVGGIYSGNGVEGNTFSPEIAGPGTHTISYRYVGGNGCVNIVTEDVEVYDLPTVSLDFVDDNQCVSSETFELNEGIPSGGIYSGLGVVGTNFDASSVGIGSYEITYIVTDENGCVNQDTDLIVVSNATDVSLVIPNNIICQEETSVGLSGGMPTGGTYNGAGVTNNVFNAFEAGLGLHEITYTFDDGVCINVITDGIEVISTPATVLNLTINQACFGEDHVILSGGSPEGGTFSGVGVSEGVFNTLDSGVGSFEITYSFQGLNGCIGQVSDTIVVHDLPTVGLELTDDVACVIETVHLLDGMSPAGGFFSGTGVTETNFNPSVAGPGMHEIVYSYVDDFGCKNFASDFISVVDIPEPSLTLPTQTICEDETLTLTGGQPEGGTWIGDGVIGNTFDASIAGPGIHTISYNFSVSECNTTVSDEITVYALPSVSVAFTQTEFCFGETYTLVGETPTGGVWSGTGVIGDVFDSVIAESGDHEITYTFTTDDGCIETFITTVTVFEETDVNLILTTDEDCIDNTILALSGGSPAGGVWSGPGVTGSNFDASAAGEGLHSITYSFTDNNGCIKEAIDQIQVRDKPDVTLDLSTNNSCPDESSVTLSGGWPLGGVYSGPGVAGNTIDVSLAGVGTHIIEYTVNVDGCTSSVTDEFEVFPSYSEALILDEEGVCLGFNLNLESNGPAGGQYDGPGVNSWNGTFSSVVAGIGTHTIYYNFIDGNGCTVQISDQLTVYDIPPANLTLDNDRVCATEENIVLSGGSPAGGTYSGTGVSENVFNPLSVGAGTYTITYSYIDSNGCTAEAIDEIVVDPTPSVTYTFENDHCNQNDGSVSFVFQDQLNISHIEFSVNGGINWRPPIEDSFGGITYSNLSAGAYNLMVRNEEGTCETDLGEIIIENIDGPTADAGPDVTISALASTQLNGSGGSFYQWTPFSDLSNPNILNPIASPNTTTTYTLEVTDIYGCTDTDQVTVTVESICAGTISEGDFPYIESFESGLGLWSQEPSQDDFDWFRNNGSISSAGPTASQGTWYMMAEEDNTTNETAIFKSPCFDLDNQSCAQFTFDYYIANAGTLTLQATSEFGQNWYTIWSDSGNQSWTTQVVDLFAYLDDDIQLRFVAEMGSSPGGSMGVDQVEFITTGCGCADTSSPFNNFNLVPDPQPFSVDIDCDGDADMLSGGDGQLFFFENNGNGTYTDQTGTGQDIMPNLNFLDMTIGLVDLDNDGDKDLSIVGNEPYNKYFYWNTGTKTNPIFTQAGSSGTPANPISGFDFSSLDGGYYIGYADPTIFWADMDNDDDFDAVVGGKLGWFQYYENIGDENTPNLVQRTGAANPFNGLRVDGADEGNGLVQYESSPLLIDWDGDGDLDLFSGNQISTVQYFENIGSASNPIFVERTGTANPFDGVIFSEDSHLSIIDEDCDGDWDVFYGVGDSALDAEITMCDLLVAVPNFAQANASQNHFCFGESIFLFEESTVGVTWSWTGPNGFTSTSQDPVLNNIDSGMAGTYTVVITNEQGCEFTSSVEITISGSSADAGPDSTIDLGGSTQNQGSGDGQTYLWSPATGLSDPTILNPIANPTATTTYTLTVFDELGCSSSDQMTVFVTTEECTYYTQIFSSDFETTTGDNFWTIGNNATDGNFLIGEPSPYTQSSTTVMEILPQEGDQSLITGNSTTYTQDLDGGPSTARSRNFLLENEANSIELSMYWYLSHYVNGDAADYLRIELRDASNNSVLEMLVDETGSSTDRDAVWTPLNADLSVHAGKTVYLFIHAVDAGNGSKLEVGIDNIVVNGTFSTIADIVLTSTDFCDENSDFILTGGTPEGGIYSGPGVVGNMFNPSDAGPGTHTITYEYSDVEGCIATAFGSIEVYQPPLTELSLAIDTVCVNQSAVGLFGGIPTGGEWSGTSVVESTFYPSDAGVGSHAITYTVTDANGCVNSVTDEIVVLTVPIITEIISTDATCNLDNGSITISFDDINDIDNIEFSLNGGFTWQALLSDMDGSVTYSDLAADIYDVWVRNANGNCPFQVENIEIENILSPLVDVGSDIDLCFGDTQSVNPIVEQGTAPISYSWSGPNDFASNQEVIDVSLVGTYSLTVTDANNCTATDDLIVNNFSLSLDAIITPIDCYGDDNGRIRASANGTSPYTYTLVGEGSNGSGVFNNLSQGNYILEVEDGYGCTITQGFNVPGPPPLSCSQDSCIRNANLAWTGNSNGPWTTSVGSTNVSLSVSNESNTDVTTFALDEFLTTDDPNWYVESAAGLPSLTISPVWDTDPDGEMTDIDELSDDKGTMTFTFTFDEAVSDVVLHLDKLGEYASNGLTGRSNSSVWTVTTPGVSLYKLSGTTDLEVLTNSFYRTYDIENDQGTDAANPTTEGSAAGSVSVYSSTPLTSVSFTVTGVGSEGLGLDELRIAISASVCTPTDSNDYNCNSSPGIATISATGGVHPYTYLWDNGETTQTASNLAAGNHNVTITDANDCIQVCSVNIEENQIEVSAGSNVSFCEGESGLLEPSVSGGVEPYLYLWSGPNGFESTEESPSVMEGGTYNLVVTDNNGCSSEDNVSLYSFVCDQTTNCYFLHEFNNFSYFGSDGTLDWADYGWDEVGDNNSAISGDVMILDGGLQIQNSNATNPSIKRKVDLGGHSSAVLSFDYSTEGDVGSNSIFRVEVFDGTSWSPVFTNIGSLVGVQTPWLDISEYISEDTELRFSIVSGYYASSKKLIIDNVRVDVDCLCEGNSDAGIDLVICEGDSIQLAGAGNGEFLWSPAAFVSDATIANPIAFPTETTTFQLTVIDEFGCEDISEMTITVNESVEAEAVPLLADYCLDGVGAASISISQGTAPFTINWQNVNGGEVGTTISSSIGTTEVNGLQGGETYCFEILDSNGCTVVP